MKSVLWAADYSQLELRIFASVTKTRWMVETFLDPNGDIHAATAERVLGIPKEKQTPSVRTRSKNLNFGMAYGAQGETIENQIIVFALRNPEMQITIPSLSECRDMVKDYWKAAPEAAEWKEWYLDRCRELGYSETLYGRRWYLPHLRHPSQDLRARAERQAVNLHIQGTASDIIKQAQLMLHREIIEQGWKADIRLQVHDELLGCIWEPELEKRQKWVDTVARFMVLDQPLRPVPLKVKPKLVTNWKEAK